MEVYEPEALAGAQALLTQRRIDALLIQCQNSMIPLIKQNLEFGKYKLLYIHSTGNIALVLIASS